MSLEVRKGNIKEILDITETEILIRFTSNRKTYIQTLKDDNYKIFIEAYKETADYYKIEFIPVWDANNHNDTIKKIVKITVVENDVDVKEFEPVDWWSVDEVNRVPTGLNNLAVNSCGGIIIAGLTGNGKTYNGLKVLDTLQDYYQDYLILNYELTKED